MQLKKGDVVEVRIIDMAFGAAGVGKIPMPDGGELVIFVEGAAPGDTVRARLTSIKKQYAEAQMELLVQPAPERITPRCKHFGVCGGCSLQFFSYNDQLKWKEKMVRDALEKIGGFKNCTIEKILGCENPWYYRNKMEYSFGPGHMLGLHPRNNYKEVFNVEECFLESPQAVEMIKVVREWAAQRELQNLRTLTIREGKNTREVMVNLITSGAEFRYEKDFAGLMSQNFPQITSLYRTGVTVQRGHRTVIKEFLLAGKKTLKETLQCKNMSLEFEILPQAFFQPNTKQAQILYAKVLEFARSTSDDSVLDLFCGTGTIGMFFAKAGAKNVTGIDNNESAIQNARENATKNNLTNVTFHSGDVFKSSLLSSSILITDPPRAGIAQSALTKILALKIPRWIYVSCNPATLARDLKIICADGGYTLQKIQPVDMFPQTYHVETVCLLTR